jgi:hypothetical protein
MLPINGGHRHGLGSCAQRWPNTVLIERRPAARRIRTAWTTETRRSQGYSSTD